MPKCPYSFPARSRRDMIDAISSIANHRRYDGRTYPFCWNVKVYGQIGTNAVDLQPLIDGQGERLDSDMDSAFERHCEESESLSWRILSDMCNAVDDWSDYDGETDFSFTFGGRSGGWLILESAHGFDFERARFDPRDFDNVATSLVRKLYRSLVVMESDFTRAKVESEYAYQLANYRQQWQGERRERASELREEAAKARQIAARLDSDRQGLALPESIADTLTSRIQTYQATADAQDSEAARLLCLKICPEDGNGLADDGVCGFCGNTPDAYAESVA